MEIERTPTFVVNYTDAAYDARDRPSVAGGLAAVRGFYAVIHQMTRFPGEFEKLYDALDKTCSLGTSVPREALRLVLANSWRAFVTFDCVPGEKTAVLVKFRFYTVGLGLSQDPMLAVVFDGERGDFIGIIQSANFQCS